VVQDRPDVVQKVIPLMKIAGVSLDYYNKLRQTSLHLAVITDMPHMFMYLVRHGASPSLPDRHGNSCLHLAVLHNAKQCLSVMLKTKPLPGLSTKNYEGLTPMHVATQEGHGNLILALLTSGAEIDSQDGKSGRTPLHHAVETNQRDLVELLLAKGASVNQQSYSGSTALHVASGRSYLDVVGLLVKFGADTTIKNVYLEPADFQVPMRKSSSSSLPKSSTTSSASAGNKRNPNGKGTKSSQRKAKQDKTKR
jgi:B-cell CLL/lymphoma protein 3